MLLSVSGMAVGITLSTSAFSQTLMISFFWQNQLTMSYVRFIGLSALSPKSANQSTTTKPRRCTSGKSPTYTSAWRNAILWIDVKNSNTSGYAHPTQKLFFDLVSTNRGQPRLNTAQSSTKKRMTLLILVSVV